MANWISSAIRRPGAFRRKAKAAGESTMEYAREKMHAGGTTGRQARLAMTLSKLRKRRSITGRSRYAADR